MGCCHSKKDKKVEKQRRNKERTMRVKNPEQIRSSSSFKEEEDLRYYILNHFEKYDGNKDGQLDQEELTLFFEEIAGKRKFKGRSGPREMAEKLIKLADEDGDKKLSRDQIFDFLKKH